MIHIIHYDSKVGKIMVAEEGGSIIGLWMEGQKYFYDLNKNDILEKEVPVLTQAKQWLDSYFSGDKPRIDKLQLNPMGSEFRRKVWKLLCEIPYGNITTYGEIAKKLANDMGKKKMSAQAVGGAIGHNPISIIIPCHRVVGTNGNLTGYAGGIDKKVKLLMHEGVDMSKLFVPSYNLND